MKSKTLLTMFGIALLTSSAVPALAGDRNLDYDLWELQQLKMTDGYTEPTAAPAFRIGKSSDDAQLRKQQMTEREPGIPSRSGVAGRASRFEEESLFERLPN